MIHIHDDECVGAQSFENDQSSERLVEYGLVGGVHGGKAEKLYTIDEGGRRQIKQKLNKLPR